MPVGTQVVGIRQALQKRRGLLLAHAHARGNCGGRLLLVAHARKTLQQRTLAGRQIIQPTLIEWRDPVEQHMELLLHPVNRLVGNQLVEHHRQPWIPAGHAIERLQPRCHILHGRQHVRAFLPI